MNKVTDITGDPSCICEFFGEHLSLTPEEKHFMEREYESYSNHITEKNVALGVYIMEHPEEMFVYPVM